MSADQPSTSEPVEPEVPAASATSGEPRDPAEETKRRFREALAAKQGRHGEDHLDANQHPGHAHGRPDSKRSTFRRKTG